MRIASFLMFTLWSTLSPIASMAQSNGTDERPYNAALYKASHNSYQRDESLADQIDNYNVWQIELDVADYDGKLYVAHDCVAPFTGFPTLQQLLAALVRDSKTYTSKFTMIYLDMKGNGGDYCQIPWGPTLQARLKSAFTQTLTEKAIYSSKEFVDHDASTWPSYQELVRRGHYWGVIIDWHGKNPTTSDDLVFFATGNNPPKSDASDNTVLVNIDGGCDSYPTDEAPLERNGRWLYRGYPGKCGEGLCNLQNDNYWSNLIALGFNYLATNCVNWDHTLDPRTQSPVPLFVENAGHEKCPMSYSQCEWGTLAYPFHNLEHALARASRGTEIDLRAGVFSLSTPSERYTIKQPITLRSIEGSSVIK